jgi:DNA replication initiation complex subunit (GINS family)
MINYADIQKIYMNEKAATELQKIDDCFYYDAADLLTKIEAEHREHISKRVYEIFERRRNKIVFAALRSGQKEPANMVPAEKKFYGKLTKDLEDYKEILSGEPARENEGDKVSVNTHIKKVKVKFLIPFPSIIGSDMVHYGPFKEGDVADMPLDNAQVLVDEEAAEEA